MSTSEVKFVSMKDPTPSRSLGHVGQMTPKKLVKVWMFGVCHDIPFLDEYSKLIIRSRIFKINKRAAIGVFLWANGKEVDFNKGSCDVFNVLGYETIFYNGTSERDNQQLENFVSEIPVELSTIFEIGIMIQQVRDELMFRKESGSHSFEWREEKKTKNEKSCCKIL